jgi:hypothetical protein
MSKALLERIEQLDPAEREPVLRAIPEASLRLIRDSSRTDWLDARHQIAMDAAVWEVLGEERLVQLLRSYSAQAADVPLFGPIFKGALGMFGGGPSAVYRVIPRAWGFTSRNGGTITTRITGDRAAEVVYTALPPLLRRATMAATTRGAMLGVLDIFGLEGTCSTDKSQLDAGIIAHSVRW